MDPVNVISNPTTTVRSWWGVGIGVIAVGWGAQQFAPLLLLYRAELGLSSTVVQATFGLYVFGLIPGLLLGGPVSDRNGRRRVVLPALGLSLVGTALMTLGGTGVGWLFAGRLLAGIASGAAFSAGAAWIKELSAADPTAAPRRITVAMSVGFGVGPLVAGVLAQWAPAPTVLPYLPHVALTLAAIPLAWRMPETRPAAVPAGPLRLRVHGMSSRRFRTVVVPLAPWVFGTAAIAVAYLPGVLQPRLGGYAIAFSALVTLLAAGCGIAVQPLARRLDTPGGPACSRRRWGSWCSACWWPRGPRRRSSRSSP